ncbi:MAG: hypothetical protein QW165_00015 [Candidatus Woesearchaeota archaeon]
MGTLESFVPILGIFAGCIIAKLTPYELKKGEKYLKLLMYLLLSNVIGIATWQYMHRVQVDVAIPFFLFFIPFGTLYHEKYNVLISVAAVYTAIALLLF